MEAKLLVIFFFIINLSSLLSAMQAPLSSALDVLSDSGYFSMALTLQLTSTALNLSDSANITIFAPSDPAFTESGQPSLLDLRYQVSPVRLSGDSVRKLPQGAIIPTLRSDTSLIVRDSLEPEGKLSINDVVVQDCPLFDDGYLVIYGTDAFFKPFPISPISAPSPIFNVSPNPYAPPGLSPVPSTPSRLTLGSTTAPSPSPADSLSHSGQTLPNSSPSRSIPIFPSSLSLSDTNLSELLMSRGFTIMGTFLDLQLQNPSNKTKLTVFAPVDDAITESTTSFSNYSTIFKAHVVQKLLTWKNLRICEEKRLVLHSALRGFEIKLSLSGDILLLNGVPIVFPDLYVSDYIAVHGLNRMIVPQSKQDPMGESFSELDGGEDDNQGDYGNN